MQWYRTGLFLTVDIKSVCCYNSGRVNETELEMKVAVYRSQSYYVISTMGESIELAPTPHGAGSFIVHQDFVKFIGEWVAPSTK